MQLIEGIVRSYAWGSRTQLAELTGRPSPTAHPEAEVWFGAHPAAPSRVVELDSPLDEHIASDLSGQLGADRESLPFLLKLLSAEKALSLQAHPSKQQAEEGFARENQEGIPLGAFERNYKDPNHKPELLVALGEFDALAGFRPVAQTLRLIELLGIPDLTNLAAMLGSGDDAVDIRGLFTTLVALPQDSVIRLIDAIVERSNDLLNKAESGHRATGGDGDGELESWMAGALRTAVMLADQYPGDAGVVCSLLLNTVTLQAGEALYLDAGQLHAYLRGTGVEIMANSDNVLRSGLTTKHIDVPELMRVLDCSPLEDPRIFPEDDGAYVTPAPDFALRRVAPGYEHTVAGPAIVLAVGGDVQLSDSTPCALSLATGHAVWVPASAQPVTVSVAAGGQGEPSSFGFIATVGK